MRHLVSAFALVPMMLVACGDDPVKPGSLTVNWTHPSTATCGSRFVTQLEARALKGTEVIATSGKVACPAADRSGSIPLDDLDPGSYRIEVEGFDQGGNGTYFGAIAKQSVSGGKVTETADIQLGQKPVSIAIIWTVPGGVQCSQAGIEEVKVDVIYDASTASNEAATQTIDCSVGEVLFNDLEPNDDVAIILTALNEDGEAVATATVDGESLQAGEEFEETVPLVACPGTPPACP